MPTDITRIEVAGQEAVFDSSTDATRKILSILERFERRGVGKLLHELRPDDVVLDVGANIGFYSCFIAKHVESGHVIAVEPYHSNIPILLQNLKQNTQTDQYTIVNTVLDNEPGVVKFSQPGDDPGFPLGHIKPDHDYESSHVLRTTETGDTLFTRAELPTPTVVKIDVEGAESRVIDGLSETLSNDACRLLHCEIHLEVEVPEDTQPPRPSVKDHGETLMSVCKQIQDYGFEIDYTRRRAHEVHIIARK